MSQSTTCRTCGASLQPDQRYCLSCGTRVTAPRLDFIAEMERVEAAGGSAPEGVPAGLTPASAAAPATAAQPAVVAAAPAAAPSRLDKIGGPMGAAAVVLVALGVGFLIGRGGDEAPVAQRAPVVNIQGGLPSGGAATTPQASDVRATGGDSAGGDGGSGANGDAAGRRTADDAARVAESTRDIPKSTGSDAGGDLERLRREPIETATPGAPPPKDNKPAGGGTEAKVIG